jgi:hypothetical protein
MRRSQKVPTIRGKAQLRGVIDLSSWDEAGNTYDVGGPLETADDTV